jgi:hypothetical protein
LAALNFMGRHPTAFLTKNPISSIIRLLLASSSSGLGQLVLIQQIAGSNPAEVTKTQFPTYNFHKTLKSPSYTTFQLLLSNAED